jgi:hypothetical protein
MKLFKKREQPFAYPDYYLQLQNWWVARMSNLTRDLSKTKLISLLIGFVVLTAGYLIYNICAELLRDNSPSKNTPAISKVKTINQKK